MDNIKVMMSVFRGKRCISGIQMEESEVALGN